MESLTGLYSRGDWKLYYIISLRKSYFIPYIVNYEVRLTLMYIMSSDFMYYNFRDTLFPCIMWSEHKKSKCQRHKKVKLPSNPGITHSKSKKETLATTVVACVVTLKFSKSTALLQARKKVKVVGLKKPEQFNIRRDGQTWYPKQQ